MRTSRLLLLLVLLGGSLAHATVIAAYTGNPFTGVVGTNLAGDTLSDFISVTLTFSSLPANNPYANAVLPYLTDWSITDNDGHTLSSSAGDSIARLLLTTDSSGNVTADWWVEATSVTGIDLETIYHNGTTRDRYFDSSVSGGAFNGGTPGPFGTWVTSTPEPATTGLLLSGLALFAVRLRRRVR